MVAGVIQRAWVCVDDQFQNDARVPSGVLGCGGYRQTRGDRFPIVVLHYQEALDAFYLTSRTEGIIPALETAHGLAAAYKAAESMATDEILVINMSGRGDKDVESIA